MAVINARDDLVPGFVGLELLASQLFEHVEANLSRIFAGGMKHDHVAPVLGPVAGVFATAEQGVDQPGRLSLERSPRNDWTCIGVGGRPTMSK